MRTNSEGSYAAFPFAVTVAIADGPKFSATGGGKDSRRSFALFNFCDARQHVECFRDFLDNRFDL